MDRAVRFKSAVTLLGRFPALAGVDLEVSRGEVVLLSGPNGAGKTTLLRACAGLVRVIDGEAEVLGIDLRVRPTAVRAQVALLGHDPFLYDDLTVEENLRFVARPAEPRRIEAAIARLGLAGRLRSVPVHRLSAGQRRRVALAALVARPAELWLLDEPHAGLDAEGREVLDGLVTQAAGDGTTVLMASHELDRARALAGRVVMLAGGQVAQATREPLRTPSVA